MNENLCRALLQGRLTEQDVATRLQVDPKTVRRWLEGRLPYLRHRWALAAMLGVDESDLWPQLRAAGAVSAEVRAIYPHLDAVPREVWLDLFGLAKQEIDILAVSEMPFAGDPAIMAALAGRAHAGVKVRVCLAAMHGPREGEATRPSDAGIGGHAVLRAPLRKAGDVQVRQCLAAAYHSIYRVDDQLVVSQHAYGIPAQQSPVIWLQHTAGSTMVPVYLAEFERLWAGGLPWADGQ